MRKSLFLLTFSMLVFINYSWAQSTEIKIIEVVKSKSGLVDECKYYYEMNWKKFRVVALERKIISGYEICFSEADEENNIEITLITKYNSEEQFQKSEKAFTALIKEIGGSKPALMNDKYPGDFRERVYVNTFRN